MLCWLANSIISPIIAHNKCDNAALLHEVRGEKPEHAASAVITSATAHTTAVAKVSAVCSVAMNGSGFRARRAGIPRTARALLAVDFDAAVGIIGIYDVIPHFRANDSTIDCVLKQGVGELAGRFDEMAGREV